jgi:hypothetical protein
VVDEEDDLVSTVAVEARRAKEEDCPWILCMDDDGGEKASAMPAEDSRRHANVTVICVVFWFVLFMVWVLLLEGGRC